MSLIEQSKIKSEKRLLSISLYGVVLFVIAESLMALATSSQSILMDALYGVADFAMIVISIKIIPLLYRPTSEKHPFGLSQMESIFIAIKGSMLTAVTLGLVLNNILIIISGGNSVPFTSISIFELIAGIICSGMLFLLVKKNKQLNSSIVKAEIDAWTIDTVASIGLAVAFILPAIIHTSWMDSFAPYLDQVVAIILSAMILPMPVKTAISGLRDLFLLAPEDEMVDRIKEIGADVLGKYNLEQTAYDIIKTGRKIWISVYFNSSGDTISIKLIKKAHRDFETELNKEFSDLYVELIPEVEP